MLFRVTPDAEDARIVRVEGEIDMAEADAFERELHAVLTAGNTHAVDMSGVTFIDSSGLRALFRCGEGLNGEGPLVVVNASRFVSTLMKIVGLDEAEHVVLADGRA
jgi:anti-sigma B factor antagonist